MYEFPHHVSRPDDEELTRDESRLLVECNRTIDRDEVEPLANEFDHRLEDDVGGDGPGGTINHSDTRDWLRSDGDTKDIAADLEEHADVEWVAPVYKRGGMGGLTARLAIIPDVLLVRYTDDVERRPEASAEMVSKLADADDLQKDESESELARPPPLLRTPSRSDHRSGLR